MELLQAIGVICIVFALLCIIGNIIYARLWQRANQDRIESFKAIPGNSQLTLYPKNHSIRMSIFLVIGVLGIVMAIVAGIYMV